MDVEVTSSEAVPLSPVDDAPSVHEGASTSLGVVVGHGGMSVGVSSGQHLKNLNTDKIVVYSSIIVTRGFKFRNGATVHMLLIY